MSDRSGYFRERYLKSRYGMTEGEWESQFREKGAAPPCDCCGLRGGELVADIHETTGRLRGRVCRRCKGVIGFSGADPELLATVALYLSGATRATVGREGLREQLGDRRDWDGLEATEEDAGRGDTDVEDPGAARG